MTSTATRTGISFPLKDLAFAQQLHESASECLPEFARIIRKHGLEDVVTIRLLHTHFPLDRGDALIHRWRGDGFETRPASVPEGAVACTFTPSRTEPGGLDVIEYLEPGEGQAVAPELARRVLDCSEFIAEASAVLCRNGMNTLYGFGTRFYSDRLDASDDLILVEQNNFDERRSEIAAMPRSTLGGQIWAETSWRVVGDRLVAESACITNGAMGCEVSPPPPAA